MDVCLAFFIYSILGWIMESTYCSIIAKKWVNRGFLNGPFCPIYACGALAVVFLFPSAWKNDILILFIFGMIITSLVEYITGYLLETIFKTKWWDYSKHKFNLKGRICLENSVMFGVLVVLLIKFIHPFIMGIIDLIPFMIQLVLVCAFVIDFVWDITISTRAILRINGKTFELEKLRLEVMEKLDAKFAEIENALAEKLDIEKIKEKSSQKQAEFYQILREKVKIFSQTSSHSERRLMKAFPNMKNLRYKVAFDELKKAILKK